MIDGDYGSVLESLNSLKEKVELTKSAEISRSFSEIDLRAEQGIKKTKDKINSLLILVEKSLSTGNHENSDDKLKLYYNVRSELKQFQDKINKENLGSDFEQVNEKINKIKEKMDDFYYDLIREIIETGRILTEQKKFEDSINLMNDIFKIIGNIYDFKLRSEIKEKIQANSVLVYSTIIEKETETIHELIALNKFDESIRIIKPLFNIADIFYDIKLQNEFKDMIRANSDFIYSAMIKAEIETIHELNIMKNFDDSLRIIKDISPISKNLFDPKLRNEIKELIKNNSDIIYSAMIKTENETSLELSNLKKFDESIKNLENTLNIAINIYDMELQNKSIEEINQLIYKIRITKIKNSVLDLGLRFPRLQASDIAEECGEDEGVIVSTIKEMIINDEIYAKYFENSRSVAFDQRRMEGEIEKFTERLDKQFEEWGKKEQSKTGKKPY